MKSREYIKEYKKQNGIDDLNKIKNKIETLIKICSNRDKLGDKTKQNIISLKELFMEVFDTEIDKELSKQKAEGKEFLSSEEIDEIVEKAKKENGL